MLANGIPGGIRTPGRRLRRIYGHMRGALK